MASSLEDLRAALAGRYEIERELGHGGMATVYLAHDLKHDRQVAVKVVRPELAAVIGAERFLNEIKVTANLQHPHILPLCDSGEIDGFLYYVMPYVKGESLRALLDRKKQLPIDRALEITKVVASALGHAHRQGVIHRDIKPENILLADDGQALVADFGIALAVKEAGGTRLTGTGMSLGTPEYMSPEQAMGERELDARSDVYSLGCVLYEMLAGQPPFTGATGQAILARKSIEPVPALRVVREAVPEAVDDALQKSLSRVAADRFGSAEDFARALTQHEPIGSSGLSPKRRKVFLGALTILALAVVVPITWRLLTDIRPDSSRNSVPLDPRRIAVLYFDDHSDEQGSAHLAAGLTEALIQELSQVEGLEVISRNGVKPYRNGEAGVDSIARDLRVGTFVEGSLVRSGNRLRVTVQLIDAATSAHLASRTIERPWGEWFALQDDLSREVSLFLRERLGQEIELRRRRVHTKSAAAWELVQQAIQLLESAESLFQSTSDLIAVRGLLQEADSLLSRAGSLDPTWPEPIIHRGRIAFLSLFPSLAHVDFDSLPAAFDTAMQEAVGYADHALQLDPQEASALELRGSVYALRAWVETALPERDRWFDLAEGDFRSALAADGSRARAWGELSKVLQTRGRFSEANVAARRALAEDPFLADANQILQRLFWTSLEVSLDAEAVQWCDEGRRRFADQSWTVECTFALMALSDALQPDPAKAWSMSWDYLEEFGGSVERRDRLRADWHITIGAILARAGLIDSARAVVRQGWQRWKADSSFGMTLHELYVAALVEDTLLMSFVAREHMFAEYDTLFLTGDFWGRALLRDTTLRQRIGLGEQP